MAQCKLCQQEKPLIRKSHIIPDFMYQALYDEKHRLRKITPAKYVEGDEEPELKQTGEYEGNILCKECDNEVIGQLESYASAAIYGKAKLPAKENPNVEHYKSGDGIFFSHITNIDYTKFKLFLLSVLWRSHISTRDFFKEINLGDDEEALRNMILNRDPKGVMDYPPIIFTFIKDDLVPHDMVAQPTFIKMQNSKAAVFIIHGMIYLISMGGEEVPDYFEAQTIKPKNEMTIVHLPEGMAIEMILKHAGMK